jgi:hypothetical protein
MIKVENGRLNLSILLQDGIQVKAVMVVKARFDSDSSITNEVEFREAIHRAVTTWCKQTESGQRTYVNVGDFFNVSDLAQLNDEDMEYIRCRIPGCIGLQVEGPDIADDWVFDTSLCDEMEDEDEDD